MKKYKNIKLLALISVVIANWYYLIYVIMTISSLRILSLNILILLGPIIIKISCSILLYFVVFGFCELIERSIRIDKKLSLFLKNNQKEE